MLVLRQVGGNAEGLAHRRHRRRPDGQAADRARRVHVPLEQRRGDLQDPRDVVEPVALVVGRDQRRGIDVERQQIADCVLILGAVEAVQRLRAPRVGLRRRHAIDLRLQPGSEPVADGRVRARSSGGRHGAGPELPDHLLPDVGPGRHVGKIGGPERNRDRTAGGEPLVVARDAVPLEQRLVPGDGRRLLRGRFLPRAGRGHGGEPDRPSCHPDAEQHGSASHHGPFLWPRPASRRSALHNCPNLLILRCSRRLSTVNRRHSLAAGRVDFAAAPRALTRTRSDAVACGITIVPAARPACAI